ncbi:MAG TPA: aquaporin [Thermoplasmata archaeon]|nr:aquaporin [Thermoplasmata archaeon]
MAWSAGQKYLAEFLGTFALLLFGGGAAVFSLGDPGNARVVLVSLAFGTVLIGAIYALGDVSGGHFNPAVTLSMALSRRMPLRDVLPYLVSQIVGGIVGIAVVFGIAHGSAISFDLAQGAALGSQCYSGSGAPPGCGFAVGSVFLLELALTFVFVLVIQFVTRSENGAKNLAPIAIGATLLVANLVAINVDGASLNPVRSFSPAVVALYWSNASWAIQESWLFWVAPILGGLLASVVEMWFRPTAAPAPA